jgi:tRNA threonylcarbamoyl adenosine modification protein YeaZ
MRFTLGIDTAGLEGSVALAADGAVVAEDALPPGGHSGVLAAAVDGLLAPRGISVRDLAAIAVSKGPGSFTGLRIGLAWAKGAACGSDVPLILVSPHAAAAHLHRGQARAIGTVIPGERGFVEAAFWKGGSPAEAAWGPEIVAEEEVLARMTELAAGQPLAVISATPKVLLAMEDALEELSENGAVAVNLIPAAPLGAAIAELGDLAFLAGVRDDVLSATPAYGRAPNARKPR